MGQYAFPRRLTKSGIYSCYQKYYYDNKGQVIRCDDSRRNQSITYEYDNRGNLTQRNYYAYTTGEITENTNITAETEYEFDYENNVWIDAVACSTDNLLYDDNYIYDENGNPLNIDYQEFEWTNGRQLKSITYHAENSTTKALEYTYDENGLRTSKTFGYSKTEYIYDGEKLLAEIETDIDNGHLFDRKEYFYDINDEIAGFTRRNGQDTYFYLKDAEGDVIGLTDGNGAIKAGYYYDAWGKTGHIGGVSWQNNINYRSCYYDDENMVYYLQSRYYNPQWGRFLNADLPEIAQRSKDEINGLNLFAYCCNDPVNNSDPSGFEIALSTIAIASIIVSALLIVGVVITIYYLLNCTDFKPAINAISDLNTNYGLGRKAIVAFLKEYIKSTYKFARQYISKLSKAASAAIVIACANKKIKLKVKKNSKQRYWIAFLKYIYDAPYIELGTSVVFSFAVSTIIAKGNIFTVLKREARNLAKRCGGIYQYHSNNAHNGYFAHYHPNVSKKSHIWFAF